MDEIDDFIRLRDLVNQGKSKLLEYKKLYVVNNFNKRKMILDSIAPGFFNYLFQLFWSDMILSISRLTDKATMMHKKEVLENLTIDRLIESWKLKDKVTFEKLKLKQNELVEIGIDIRTYRSKNLAHQDYKQAMDPALIVRLETIEKAFFIVEEILNIHSVKIGMGYYGFGCSPIAGVESLVHMMIDSLVYNKMKKDRKSITDDTNEMKKWEESLLENFKM